MNKKEIHNILFIKYAIDMGKLDSARCAVNSMLIKRDKEELLNELEEYITEEKREHPYVNAAYEHLKREIKILPYE